MNTSKILLLNIAIIFSLNLSAKDYKASLFGVKSDGITLNTGSIQYAIDYISENGGGNLVFYVGRYLTGSFYLKSNVTIQLEEGAVLVAFSSIYNYFSINGTNALILGDNLENIGITGKGVIEGQGKAVLNSIKEQIRKGYIEETESQVKPALINLNNCKNVTIDGFILRDACGDYQVISGCNDVKINNITVKDATFPDSNGITLSNSDGLLLSNSYFEIPGKEINRKGSSRNISIKNCINSKGKKIK